MTTTCSTVLICTLLLLLSSTCWKSSYALNEVSSFAIRTENTVDAHTIGRVQVTLWYNYTIYQHSFDVTREDTWYTATKNDYPQFEILGSSACHKSQYSSIPEAKMMISNPNADAVRIDTITFSTESGTYYGIDRFICIENEGHCTPSKQIFHFDTTRPNEDITDASYTDGTSVTPDIITCEPTQFPTLTPSEYPSNYPTKFPTNYPTVSPTNDPSQYPSVSPSNPILSYNPTINPTINPSINPTIKPASNPTFIATITLTINPTVDPTVSTTYVDDSFDTVQQDEMYKVQLQVILMIAGVIIILCLCCIVVLYSYYYLLQQEEREHVEECMDVSKPADRGAKHDFQEGSNKVGGIVRPSAKSATNGYYDGAFVTEWIEGTVKLPIYLDNFMKNGYDTMEKVLEIKSNRELSTIGIALKKHQIVIMKEIDRLRGRKGNVAVGNHGESELISEFNIKANVMQCVDDDIVNIDLLNDAEINVSGAMDDVTEGMDEEIVDADNPLIGDDEFVVGEETRGD